MTPSNKSTAAASPAMADTKPSRAPKRGKPAVPTKNAKQAVPAKKAAPPERGTKTAKILALLNRPGGASLQQLRKATGWQAHSVRGFLSGTLKKKMGLRVTATKVPDGERTYRIISK